MKSDIFSNEEPQRCGTYLVGICFPCVELLLLLFSEPLWEDSTSSSPAVSLEGLFPIVLSILILEYTIIIDKIMVLILK